MATGYTNYGATSTTSRPDRDLGNGALDDDHQRFLQLCDAVSSNIFTINAGSTTLERILKQIGTPRDKLELRDSIHFTQQKTNETILTTAQHIRQLASLINGEKPKKLQVDRLRNEFEDLVKRYTTLQKQMADKIRTTYSFQRTSAARIANDADISESSPNVEEDAKKMLIQKQSLNEIEFEQALLEERELRIRQIEEDILDVNDVFRQLGEMVHEQGEVIDTIVGNIDRTYHNVETGGAQLSKAAQLQKSYRNKLCCFVVIIALVAIVVVVALVLSLKK